MQEPQTHRRCKHCNYILQETYSGVCPECGNTFDLNNKSTYRENSASWWNRFRPFLLATIAAHFAASYFGLACYLITIYRHCGNKIFTEEIGILLIAVVSPWLWAWFWVFIAGAGAIISGSNDFVGTGIEGIFYLIGYVTVFGGVWLMVFKWLSRKK